MSAHKYLLSVPEMTRSYEPAVIIRMQSGRVLQHVMSGPLAIGQDVETGTRDFRYLPLTLW